MRQAEPYRSGKADMRLVKRHDVRHLGVVKGQGLLMRCEIVNISESGARLQIPKNRTVPTQFMLVIAIGRGPQRRCRVVWRSGAKVGVEFISRR
jgi:16S rRNA U1498 N3-methylase RsmE